MRVTPGCAWSASVRAAAAGGLLGVLLAAAPSAASDSDLDLSTARTTADLVLTVTATVPRLMTATALPSTAFTAVQDGRPVSLTSTRVVSSPAQLVVVLDGSVAGEQLSAVQSAAGDLLRSVPSQLPTTVLPGVEPTTARSALERLADLRQQPGGLLDGLAGAPTVRRLVVVIATCRAIDAEQRVIGGTDTQVSVLATGADCGAAAHRLAGPDPGVVRIGLDGPGLLGAVDAVSRALLGQYVLRIDTSGRASPVEVTVRNGDTVASASVRVPPLPTAAIPAAGGAGQRRGPLLAAATLALLAALALTLEFARRLRSRPA